MRPPRTAGLVLAHLLALALAPASARAQDAVATTPPRSPAEEKASFHLPEGFEAQLVASEPQIHKPLNIAFDDRGRLWVTDTLEYPFPAAEGTTPRDGVKILSEFGPDGRAGKVETFATGLNIPIGVLPMPGAHSALVHSIPRVLRIDASGKKEPVYQTYGAKDTHGMTNAFTWGFDGWVYACHGFSNESTVAGADKQAITMQSGNVYRMRPDGSHLEYVTHGQVNPFGLAFDPLGNLYSCDCHTKPIYQLLRGACYPSFGRPDDGLGFGPEMTTHDHGSTAISGIAVYAADHFPEPYRDTIFVGNVVTNRINHDRVEWHGATPKAIAQPDFLKSDDPWFRPSDMELGPDGALYVADFYNRIIGHYEVPLTHPGRDRERGRIWRIVYKGKTGTNPPKAPRADWSAATPHDLIEDLGHPNLAVRTLAANQLASRTFDAPLVRAVRAAASDAGHDTRRRIHALWVLHRVGKLNSRTLNRALVEGDEALRVHALRISAEQTSHDYFADLPRFALKDPSALVRRTAAEALARHPDDTNISPLLALLAETPAADTHMTHVVRMALREQLRADDAWARLDPKALSDRDRSHVADIAPGVPTPASARFLFNFLSDSNEPPDTIVRYVHHVARYGDAGVSGDLLGYVRKLASPGESRRRLGGLIGQVALFKAYHQGLQERGRALDEGGRSYALSLAGSLLDATGPQEVSAGISFAGALRLEGVRERLIRLAAGDEATEPDRSDALAALAAIDPKAALPILSRVLTDPSRPFSLRERAAALLASGGQAEAQAALVAALPTAPERLQAAIAAGLVARKAGAEALLDAVATGKASARLLQENRVAGPLGNAGIPELSARLQGLLRGLPPADKATDALIAARRVGFARSRAEADAGAKVFETNCAACHQIGGKGSKVGPQLDGVGLRGADRLLEDVLDPSRNVDQTFRLTTLALKDGRVVSGLLLREEGEILVLADAQGKDVRVPRDSVEERTIAPLSPMPSNFAAQIPEPDFYRLIAYLLSQRPTDR